MCWIILLQVYQLKLFLMIEFNQQELSGFYQQKKTPIHRLCLMVGASMYLTSSLIALGMGQQEQMVMMARMLLFNGVMLIMLAGTLAFVKDWEQSTRYSLGVYLLEMFGYMLLLLAAILEDKYNKGAVYMVGSFLISISKELIIVMLLIPKNQISQKRNTFLSSLNSCCAALMFFFGALVMEVGLEWDKGRLLGGSLDVVSGILVCISIIYMLKGQSYDGYRGIKLSMDG